MTNQTWRALVVSAHPDDIEFSCAGTVARWTDEGAEVTYCIATDGTAGTQDRDLMGKKLHDIRVAESEAAAAAVGVSEIVWLNHRDGYVEYNLDLRRDIARVFRRYKPHRFVVLDPTPVIDDRFINHPDHRAVGQASLDVSMTAGTTPGIFPELLSEGLDPWRGLRELWITGPAGGPVVVDITSTIDRKIESLVCHRSQIGDDAAAVGEWVKGWCAELGEPHGYEYAESFRVISQGPGFHAGEQDEVDFPAAEAPLDPRSSST
jgi:LmbE family N-acetylglucosaminyl deacetylase